MDKWYVGTESKPWWVEELRNQGLISRFVDDKYIIFKRRRKDVHTHCLFENDCLIFDEETKSVSIEYKDWNIGSE